MVFGSKEFPRILSISCVQQADGSRFGSGPERADVFVVDSLSGRQEPERQMFHVLITHVARQSCAGEKR